MTADNFDSGYVFMVIEASSSTSLTLPDNVTVIQSTLAPSLVVTGEQCLLT